ncbi:MAG: hypothetical protein QOJ18_44 [Microbacteriaceae bacterium]|jgi:hypothetical protein|nr:hypothetical protein [Microbacteriaceae bacterium]
MSDLEEQPELAGYEPHGDKPLRSRTTVWIIRALVILGIAALVVPEVFTTISVGKANAQRACQAWVDYAVPGAGAIAHFELFGEGGIGWQCYSVGAFGGDHHVASLGLIPGPAKIPTPRSNS